MLKKLTSVLLALALLVSLIQSSFAQQDFTVDQGCPSVVGQGETSADDHQLEYLQKELQNHYSMNYHIDLISQFSKRLKRVYLGCCCAEYGVLLVLVTFGLCKNFGTLFLLLSFAVNVVLVVSPGLNYLKNTRLPSHSIASIHTAVLNMKQQAEQSQFVDRVVNKLNILQT
ncbi:MAG: hypothetical protein LBS61_00535, partial [Endomicrobium sp.]|nr:hypothetical protein [Endomicrobium sp.]